MDLNILWFILVAVLYTGYFILEGFDMGVGILLPFLGKNDVRRRAIINTIGPHWDGNEVWLLTAGGATFAAFPIWYATLFSGFYLALFLMLLALILRAVAIEFRSKDENPKWRQAWDWAIFFGSAVPALLWGVAFANLLRGVHVDAGFAYTGNLFNLLNWYGILGGLVSLIGFTFHGALFLTLKTQGELQTAARRAAGKVWLPAVIVLVLLVAGTYLLTDIPAQWTNNPILPVAAAILALVGAGLMMRQKRDGWAFILTAAAILLVTAGFFLGMFPRVMVSIIDPAYNLTVYNSASGATTLKTMSIVALIFVPIVLAYQGWSYWIFRKRVVEKAETLHY